MLLGFEGQFEAPTEPASRQEGAALRCLLPLDNYIVHSSLLHTAWQPSWASPGTGVRQRAAGSLGAHGEETWCGRWSSSSCGRLDGPRDL